MAVKKSERVHESLRHLLKRERQVYTEIVPDCSSTTLQAIIRGKARPKDSVIN